ncbi:MAG: hypothetical protein H0T46_33030 [Deltaproteobacteria bacterium]|nr:hypothetical protein [Deltaproteobacteria bacterium]
MPTTTHVVLVLADLIAADPPLTNAFVAELATRTQAHGNDLAFPMSWLVVRQSLPQLAGYMTDELVRFDYFAEVQHRERRGDGFDPKRHHGAAGWVRADLGGASEYMRG